MAGPELLLDSNIRMWVVLPIVFVTFFVGVIRHYVTQLLHSDKKVELEQVSDSIAAEPHIARKWEIPSKTDTSMLTDMMKGNLTNVLPMIVIGGWINWAFSGFVTTKVPFPLTLRFKPMLQRGIELMSLDASWVSSASWYFLNVFGLRSMYNLILGHDNAAMAMPPDPNKAFKSEWEALEIVEHKWALENVEEELMSRDLNFGGFFSRELKTTMF
ncbi:hypothetical protein JZ751_003277 [Albula glossodonta]|uniref:ER membrane protein complex subunit 3 n=1 Tax=Albula glossodonta TaxID=121402 RepID=A0A8T2NE79_9TELE|nr:hypothetical protein JZ751_003277 [Albula glossodonta]